MCPQNQPEGLIFIPRISVSQGSIFSLLVDLMNIIPVFCEFLTSLVVAGAICLWWVRDVKSILQVTGRVLLRNEKGIKVPEARLNETIG